MSDSEEDVAVERQIKISLVGEPTTGKSMLCARYLGFQWAGSLAPTQGAEVLLGECPVYPNRPHVPIKFWDIAGNSCNTTMLTNYLYASNIIILVYDVTNLQSFERLSHWLNVVKDITEDDENPPIYSLFGNKCDLEHQRAVRLASAQSFAQDNNLVSFVGSARTGENIGSVIITLVSRVLGIPVNKTLFNNTVIRAELAPNVKQMANERKRSMNSIQNIRDANLNKKNSEEGQDKHEKKDKNRRANKKALRELKKKASSTVCSLQ